MQAWRTANVRLIPGHPELDQVEDYVRNYEMAYTIHGLINLGVSQFDPSESDEDRGYAFWWNRGQAIRMTRRPGDLRTHMGDLLPPIPTEFPADVWIKGPGHKGQGKDRQIISGLPLFLPRGTDIQLHVEGREFRVITVYHKVVQAFERTEAPGTTTREYTWRGVSNTPRAVKELAREASRRVPGYNMYGWDIMLGTTVHDTEPKPYLLEGNSSPGVNTNTVRRIIDMMGIVYLETIQHVTLTNDTDELPEDTNQEDTPPWA
jgi:hypothetical protein